MTATLALTIAGWAWVLAGIGLLVAVVYITFAEDPDEPLAHLVVLAASVGAIGSVVLGLRFLGFPAAALWAWRAESIPYVFVAASLLQKSGPSSGVVVPGRARPLWSLNRTTALLNLLVALFLAATSLMIRQIQPATEVASPSSTFVIDGVRTWHGAALGILGAGTVLFLILFVRMVERGVTPQLESHWGGIGGGMSGWRLSASLTYLLAAAVFGVLFAIFVVQLDVGAEEKPPAVAQPAAKVAAPAKTAPAPNR
jgi:hypothetical protein